jgi:actin related protein 2/3 complex, subunit 5
MKEQHTSSVIDVLNAIKAMDIASHLTSLDVDAQDTLMKYLYKGMEQPKVYNTAVLLNWHEKVYLPIR